MHIAPRISKGRKAIQIQAEALRDWKPSALLHGRQGLMTMPGDPAKDAGDSGAGPEWYAVDLKRAIAVADEAGLTSYRVEIAPDGTISLIVADQT